MEERALPQDCLDEVVTNAASACAPGLAEAGARDAMVMVGHDRIALLP